MAGKFEWTASSTEVKADNFNKHLNRSHVNLLRGSFFESWSAGTSAAPDGFIWTANDGVLAQESSTSFVDCGNYSAKITKAAADSSYSLLYQDIRKLHLPVGYYTVVGRVHCNVASGCDVFIHDGSYNSSSAHTGGGSFETLSLSYELTDTDTSFLVGFKCYKVDGLIAYCDSLALYRGEAAPYYTPNPADFAPIGQSWENDGTLTNVHGGMRFVPWKKTFTLAGGAATETESFTLTHGCQAIAAVTGSIYSATGDDVDNLNFKINNYATTGFDVVFATIDGNNLAASTVVMHGHMTLLSWDAGGEVFGD